MDKKDILNKFKLENSLGDEREKDIDLNSYFYGMFFSVITFLIIFVVSNINHSDATGATMMFISIIVGRTLYKYRKDRKNMGMVQKLSYIFLIVGGNILYISYLVKLVG